MISLPGAGLADCHATLVFGKRFILLKTPHTTRVAGRPVRELLMERTTILQLGNVLLEIIPKSELGRSRSLPRIIRSNELAAHASTLSFGETSRTLNKQTEARLEAIETTLGHLQSAIEGIQLSSHIAPESEPLDLAAQFAAMSKTLAEDLEQRLASRLDSQAQVVEQLCAESIGPIEETLEGLLVKLSDLAAQSERTTDQLANFVASAESQLSELFSWREELETSFQQSPPADPPPFSDWRDPIDSEARFAPQEETGSKDHQFQLDSYDVARDTSSDYQVEYPEELDSEGAVDYLPYDQPEQYARPELPSPYDQQIEEPLIDETLYEPLPLGGEAYFLKAPLSEEVDSAETHTENDLSRDMSIEEGTDVEIYGNDFANLSNSPLAAYLKQPLNEYSASTPDRNTDFVEDDLSWESESRQNPLSTPHYSGESPEDGHDQDPPNHDGYDLTDRLRQMLAEIRTDEEPLEPNEEVNFLDSDKESAPTSIEKDRTSILDASPELRSFDWQQGSFLENDERELSEPSIPLDRPETANNPSSAEGEQEESIEEYMQKLLQSVKQGPDGADTQGLSLDEATVRSAPRSRSEFINRATKSTPIEQPPSDSEAATSQPTSEPSRRGPTPQVDMNALRELANSNARRAIARSETKRASTTILVKVAVTSFAVAAASLILLLNGFQPNPPFAGFVAAVVIAFIWGTDCYKHYKSLQKAKSQKQPLQQNEVEDQNAVRLHKSTENGWRPTPV
jgi:hypothetical protein